MAWRPQLNVICTRCRQPREGLLHVCRSNSGRPATVKPKLSFGKCGNCHKPYGGNPLAHVCTPKSDFKHRKSRAAKREKAKARKRRQGERHDYQACSDRDCPRSLCVAFKAGQKLGYQQGFDDGFAAGFPAGQAACPFPHAA